MKANLQIGRIAGIPIQFHWSFLLVFAWILFSSWQPGQGIRVGTLGWLGAWVGLVFLIVLLHELGHALMARRFGIGTQRIVLYPLGGGAFLEKIPRNPRIEMWVAFAGPLVNLALTLLTLPLILGGNGARWQLLQLIINPQRNIILFDVAWWEYGLVLFFLINAVLALFNLLPAYPLDGGRVLRAALGTKFSYRRATIIAASAGILFAIGFLAIAYQTNDWFFAIGALVLGLLAMAELQSQRAKERLAQEQVATHYESNFHRLYLHEELTIAEAQEEVSSWDDQPIVILDSWQQVQTITTARAIQADTFTDRAEEPFLSILAAYEWTGLAPEENLLQASEKFMQNKLESLPVLDRYGKLLGVLHHAQLQAVAAGRHA